MLPNELYEEIEMTSKEAFELLIKVDNGYELTKAENKEISCIEEVLWRGIEKIPESIGIMTGLKWLKVSEDAPLTSSPMTIPDSIGDLSSLQVLDLSTTQVSSLPNTIGNLSSLQRLDLSATQINSLPESIGCLSNLQSLDLSTTQISSLPESIENLSSLQKLDLSSTQISSLPKSIWNLSGLHNLFLFDTLISSIPDSIANLSSLQDLRLGATQISSLPESIGNLSNLQNLNLSDSQIKSLPESIGNRNLSNLQSLNLSFTQISSLPESIWKLSSLQNLYLGFTRISSLSENIWKLSELQSLDLNKVPINVLPRQIGALPRLKCLILENNILSELPEEILALNLEFKNDKFYGQYDDSGIYIHGLKLKRQPISLFYQPREFIIDYYKQLKIDINETKIIFLGSEGVGKTHTIKRILNDNHKISETLKVTLGINITFKDFDTEECSYRINFWDFGGQEIMHAVQRCFLTDRTGYVVVVSTRFGDVNKQARYWLKSIESFTKGAPVVIYVNKWSEGTYYQIDEVSLRWDYPNIIDVKQCSAKDGDDAEFGEVVKAIQEMALANDSMAMSFPVSWEKVRKEIIALGGPGSQKYYISQQEFRDKCWLNGIENRDIQSWLLEWLNDLGECFSYKYEDEKSPSDNKLMIFNPEWLINAIYIIIREAGDLNVNGVIPHEGIHNKLDHSDNGTLKNVSYTKVDCNYVLELMRKFRLSYKVPGQLEEFIPALLPEKMPKDLTIDCYKKMISYEMKYKYLPENVIHNLMIQMYPYLDRYHCWRKGVVIDTQEFLNFGLLAVLDMSRDDEILRINVYSYADHEPWQLLQEIRSALLSINSSLNLEAAEYIIIGSGSASERVSVEKLLKLKKRGKTYYEGDDKDYHINELLSDTFGEAQVRNIELSRKDETDGRGIPGSGPVDYELQTMKACLIQPDEERLFSFLDENSIKPNPIPKQEDNRKLPLPFGKTKYKDIAEKTYYVDKTLIIKDILDNECEVYLFTRPRRFGKTLMMNMLRTYFEINNIDTSKYFTDKKIWQAGEKYRDYQGKYPVIDLSFASVQQDNWDDIHESLCIKIREEYNEHSELLSSDVLQNGDKEFYNRIVNESASNIEIQYSLYQLSKMLARHYNQRVIVIIDEYDAPIQNSYFNGCYDRVVDFIRILLSLVLKDNEYLQFGILTGILRIAKNSMFSGLNNVFVNSIMDEEYSEYFGFTRSEIFEMAKYYGQSDKVLELQRWYGGYRFGTTEIFNPWSVVNCFYKQCRMEPYWVYTGNHDLIKQMISGTDTETLDAFSMLMQGKEFRILFDMDIIYPDVNSEINMIFSLLLFTGYLGVTEKAEDKSDCLSCSIAIPNQEIRYIFNREIQNQCKSLLKPDIIKDFKDALLKRDSDSLTDVLHKYLMESASTFDTTHENFYHGTVFGMLAVMADQFFITSNRESGEGRYDIQLEPKDKRQTGYIIEFKAGKNKDDDELNKLAQDAINQIRGQGYQTMMKKRGVEKFCLFGIAFCGKHVKVQVEQDN